MADDSQHGVIDLPIAIACDRDRLGHELLNLLGHAPELPVLTQGIAEWRFAVVQIKAKTERMLANLDDVLLQINIRSV